VIALAGNLLAGPDIPVDVTDLALNTEARAEDVLAESRGLMLEGAGVDLTDVDGVGAYVARGLAELIAAGERPPLDAAREIWWTVGFAVPSLIPRLASIIDLASIWDEQPEDRSQIESDIVTEAKLLATAL
jgi:hypothetical protein